MSLQFELLVTGALINKIHKERVDIDDLNLDIEPEENQSFIFKDAADPKKSALVVYKSPYFHKVKGVDKALQGIKGKDARQKLFLASLLDEKVLMSVALGKAGTGKTLLSVAYALHQYFKADKDIVLIKPSNFVGGKSQVLGILPGELQSKFELLMASYMIHFRALLGSHSEHFLFEMIENKRLQILPIETARGMSLSNCTIIFDEAQNCDLHTIKTIVSRVDKSSKLILLADLGQVDVKLHKRETGLYKMLMSDAFKCSSFTSVLRLLSQYRSPLADLMETIWDEYHPEDAEENGLI